MSGCCCNPSKGKTSPIPAERVTETQAVDPVCGMNVNIGPDTPRAEYDGITHYFCCGGCRQKFVTRPQEFLRHF